MGFNKIILFLCISLLSLNLLANSQKQDQKQNLENNFENLISFTPTLIGLEFNYERKVTSWLSILAPMTITYMPFKWAEDLIGNIDPIAYDLWDLEDTSLNILEIMPGVGVKFYLNNRALGDSWYIKTYFNMGYLRYAETDPKGSDVTNGWVARAVLTAGYGWTWDNGFMFGLDVGALMAWHHLDTHVKWLPLPKLDLTFGYAF